MEKILALFILYQMSDDLKVEQIRNNLSKMEKQN